MRGSTRAQQGGNPSTSFKSDAARALLTRAHVKLTSCSLNAQLEPPRVTSLPTETAVVTPWWINVVIPSQHVYKGASQNKPLSSPYKELRVICPPMAAWRSASFCLLGCSRAAPRRSWHDWYRRCAPNRPEPAGRITPPCSERAAVRAAPPPHSSTQRKVETRAARP